MERDTRQAGWRPRMATCLCLNKQQKLMTLFSGAADQDRARQPRAVETRRRSWGGGDVVAEDRMDAHEAGGGAEGRR